MNRNMIGDWIMVLIVLSVVYVCISRYSEDRAIGVYQSIKPNSR
jgi:hypothetical protein